MTIAVLHKSIMITAFVAVMMLVVEYLNVQTNGLWLAALRGGRWRQYLLATALGAIPGCLGAYVVVALWGHRKLSTGAVVAAMITTSGDETFVMLALFPTTAIVMTLGLGIIGIAAAWVTDTWAPASWHRAKPGTHCDLEVHGDDACHCFPSGQILAQWSPPSPYRTTLVLALALFGLALTLGRVGPADWGWERVTFLVLMGVGLFISATVPDHFLEEHLWRHVAIRHVPRIFAWTTGVLWILALLASVVDLSSLVSNNRWETLAAAVTLGIVPESGPHLIFVTMYSEGLIPLSILVASSIVQDGHGMLPLLSISKRSFLFIKLLNVLVGLLVGGVMLAVGF